MADSDTKTPKAAGSHIPANSLATDGWSTEDRATATCFCGAVQLEFPTSGPHLLTTFLCHCPDCRKITASRFASNFAVTSTSLAHRRGRANLTAFAQSQTIASGNSMTNYFCATCGSLMYRVSSGSPGVSILRIGTVDDFALHETKLKPRVEQFVEGRVGWLGEGEGMGQKRGAAL
ncbi:Mss4-like protein [Massariosphaeria phaeospora]|uniref:Mss4-like protein n=1 Tax=Massariosphaeria phaeospora TaxID=100035 RepID=A0A7C8M281_9PLEO|nr:Mss4-like protein [Massariosphaeria phaeospora]